MAKAKEGRDRVVLVTGAGSGIGGATVVRLLHAGWKVAAVDRDGTALASLAEHRQAATLCAWPVAPQGALSVARQAT